jgi:signal transduction histidine kinase
VSFYAGRMRGAGSAVLVAAAISGVATLSVALVPQLHFAYRQPSLHAALETAASLTALLAGGLVAGRFQRSRQLNELLLACALAVLALLNFFCRAVPALAERIPDSLMVWSILTGGAVGAGLFALAAFVPLRRLRRHGLALAGGAGALAAGLLVAAVVVEFAGRSPRTAVGPPPPDLPVPHDLHAQPAVLTLQLFMVLTYGLAAAGYLRGARRRDEEFLAWLAIAAVLAAASHLDYFLYPSMYFPWVHAGDIFRLGCYAVILLGSVREISSYWHALSTAAALEERRRIACDLHDGLAQELAYLARNLDALGGEAGDDVLTRLRRAVERAQLESRRAVSTLAAPGGEALEVTLADAAAEVADRFHVGLELDLVPGVRLPAARAEALVRIACEAVANAARHSGASRVILRLEHDGPRVRLRVSDRGRGFDPAVQRGGFGLVSMHERARSVGGELRISSVPGLGSEVEAAL